MTSDQASEATGALVLTVSVAIVAGAMTILMIPTLMNDIFYHSASYNEGWNIYHSMQVSHGAPLYDKNLSRPVNYTYLSFYIVGWLGRLSGAPLVVARALSFLSFVATALSCGACVLAAGGDRIAAALAAILFAGFCAIATSEWIGTADPQFLAQALSVAGLVVHMKATTRPLRLIAAPVFFVLAIFTKQQEIAVPAAVFADICINHRRDLRAWLVVMAGLTLLLLVGGFLAGNDFLARVMMARQYNLYTSIGTTWRIMELVQIPLMIGVIWLLADYPSRFRALFCALGFTTFLCLVGFAGAIGVGNNVALDFLMWVSVVAGAGVSTFRAHRYRRMAASAALVISAGFEIELKAFLTEGRERQVWSQLVVGEKDFRRDIAFVAKRPGDAICETMLLCYYADKRLVIDPFNAAQMVVLGRLPVNTLVDPIVHRRITTIQLTGQLVSDSSGVHIANTKDPVRFGEDVRRAIVHNYKLDHISSNGAFYVPIR